MMEWFSNYDVACVCARACQVHFDAVLAVLRIHGANFMSSPLSVSLPSSSPLFGPEVPVSLSLLNDHIIEMKLQGLRVGPKALVLQVSLQQVRVVVQMSRSAYVLGLWCK